MVMLTYIVAASAVVIKRHKKNMTKLSIVNQS